MVETKYGKHVLREAFKTHHQLEGLSANGDELNADCILTHHVIYKPEIMLKVPHVHEDFQQLLCFLGTDPMNVRDFGGAVVEICLGEEQEKHINFVLKLMMDSLDWEGKVALMGEVLKRLEPHLPPEIISQPPERFAAHYESIVRAYVQSMDRVKSVFRSF